MIDTIGAFGRNSSEVSTLSASLGEWVEGGISEKFRCVAPWSCGLGFEKDGVGLLRGTSRGREEEEETEHNTCFRGSLRNPLRAERSCDSSDAEAGRRLSYLSLPVAECPR